MGIPSIISVNVIDGNTVDVVASESLSQGAAFFNTSNWAITGGVLARSVSSVSAVAPNAARLTLDVEMRTGETLTVTPSASIVSLTTGDPFNPTSADWTAVGTPPAVSSAMPVDSTTVRVNFSEGMSPTAALSSVGSYSFDPDLGGAVVSPVSAVPEAVSQPTYVDVYLSSEMTLGVDYTLSVDDSLEDAAGNPMDALSLTAEFTGVGVLPTVESAVLLSEGRRLRVTFSEPMRRDSALTTPSNYTFNVLTAGAATPYIDRIELPDGVTYPTYVDLLISELTDGASYEVVASTVGPTDRALNPVNPLGDTAAFTGVGVNPLVDRVEAVGRNRADIIFSEPMRSNSDIFEASRYTWDNGLVTLEVLEVVGNTVKLVTSDQTPGTLYNLTIDPT